MKRIKYRTQLKKGFKRKVQPKVRFADTSLVAPSFLRFQNPKGSVRHSDRLQSGRSSALNCTKKLLVAKSIATSKKLRGRLLQIGARDKNELPENVAKDHCGPCGHSALALSPVSLHSTWINAVMILSRSTSTLKRRCFPGAPHRLVRTTNKTKLSVQLPERFCQ